MTKLAVDHKLPLEHIGTLLSDLYGYVLNSETVERTLEARYVLIEALEVQTKAQLTQAAVVHCDERRAGWRERAVAAHGLQ